MPKTLQDLTGQRFGMLTVVERAEARIRPGRRQVFMWLCECDCGNRKIIAAGNLRSGNSRTCGCQGKGHESHGMNGTPEYRAWKAMRGRCHCPGVTGYEHYGGRGIKIAPAWDTFTAFLEDMGPRPGRGYSLDRIDTNKDYGPDNCRWATRQEQNSNRRSAVWVTCQGERLNMAEAARRVGITKTTLARRIKAGWPEELWLAPPGRPWDHAKRRLAA